MKAEHVPGYRRQRSKSYDRAFVRINDHRYYLGKYGSPESKEEYRRLLAEWASNAKQMLPVHHSDLTVVELIAHFWQHAQSYYRKPDGTPTTEINNYRQALRPLKDLFAHTLASEFGPKSFKAVRHRMVELGWARTNINTMTSRIKHVFRWATESELVSPSVYHGLQAVSGLKRGRTEAREPEPVTPVLDAHIEAIRPHVSRQVWALIQLQLLTAARPGELVGLRPIDLNMVGPIWTCTPAEHKTAHHGHKRTIYIGPKAQQIIQPFLANRPVDAFLFSPAEAEAERRATAHKERKTPLSSGNRPGTNKQRTPQRTPGDQYSQASYRRAIRRACDSAGIPPWHPHQLRHNAATRLRAEFGLEGAQLILGHRRADVTQIYAEVNQARALDIAARVPSEISGGVHKVASSFSNRGRKASTLSIPRAVMSCLSPAIRAF